MAEFEVKVVKLEIIEHPNADLLEIARIGDYNAIVGKEQFKSSDIAAYIPEQAVIPEWLLKKLNLGGKLAGKNHNRVKAIKLRGIFSQGLVIPQSGSLDEVFDARFENDSTMINAMIGANLADFFGIVKYDPPIPVHMAGEVFNASGMTVPYDIENIKKYPDILEDNELVVMTEKLHGTWCCFGYHPDSDVDIVTSKGLSGQGLAFKMNENNEKNLYIRALAATIDDNGDNVIKRACSVMTDEMPFYILGEIFGKGVQDLHYGQTGINFRVFDIYHGVPTQGTYLDHKKMVEVCNKIGIEMVPITYEGPFSKEKMIEVTDGKEMLSGKEFNIREGVVIRPINERRNYELGRVVLKSVSEKYLLRKGGTEFN